MRTSIVAVIAMLSTALLLAADIQVDAKGARKGIWSSDYAAVTAAAEKDKANRFLLFTGSDWCKWCIVMEKKVFSQDAWRKFAADNLYLAYIDFPSDKSKQSDELHNQNVRLQENFNVEGFPTMILLDPEGTQLATFSASESVTAESFVKQVQKALQLTPGKLEEYLQTLPAAEAEAMRQNDARHGQVKARLQRLEQEMAAKLESVQITHMLEMLRAICQTSGLYSLKQMYSLNMLKEGNEAAYKQFRQLETQYQEACQKLLKRLDDIKEPEKMTFKELENSKLDQAISRVMTLEQQMKGLLGIED